VALGGSVGRATATAEGGAMVLLKYLATIGRASARMTVAVQGFGNAGATIAKILYDAGFTIVAVSDSKGTLHSAQGLNPYEVERIKDDSGSVITAVDAASEVLSLDAVFGVPCDILIPAALDNAIGDVEAAAVTASIVLELANNPITPHADAALYARGVVVIPDVLANAGGVTVSYFEWVQNRQQYYWSEKEVFTKLEQIMLPAFLNVYQEAATRCISLRAAAYVVGVGKIAEAMRLRGIL
jgi:glutamate dehydrogenase/leucine dehydrogenase